LDLPNAEELRQRMPRSGGSSSKDFYAPPVDTSTEKYYTNALRKPNAIHGNAYRSREVNYI
jgi:hypothetical protein